MCAVLLLVAASSMAQEQPSVEDLGRKAQQLATQVTQLREAEPAQPEEVAKADQAVAGFVAQVVKLEGLTEQHYIQASAPLIEPCPGEAAKIAEVGTVRFPASRFLWDHVGFAHLGLGFGMKPCAAQLVELQAAAAAFRKALPLQPDTFHAHLGLFQVLSLLDQLDEAAQQLELVAKDSDGKAALPHLWVHRVGLLLRSGKPQDALAVLGGDGVPEAAAKAAQVMKLRAQALAGDAAGAQASIAKMRAEDPGPLSLVVAADALVWLGKKDEALKLLAQRPPVGPFTDEEGRVAQELTRSAAAMEAFLKATDFTPKGPLRAALTKALDHHFEFVDAGAKGGPAKVDLASSPLLMTNLLASAPKSPEGDWANRMLQVLCVRALADYKPSALETKVAGYLKGQRFAKAEDEPAVLLAMRWALADPDAVGVLTGLRAAEKLRGKPAEKGDKKGAPAKK